MKLSESDARLNQAGEGDKSSWSIRSRFPLLIILIILGSVIVGIPAYYYFQSLRSAVQPEQEASTASRPTPTGVPPWKGSMPTLDRISQCANGIFPEHPNLLKSSKDNAFPFGLVLEKENTERPMIKVENIYDGSIVDVDLSELVRFDFREIIDRKRYPLGAADSFYYKNINIGEPYTLNEIYSRIPIGSHVWVPFFEEIGLVLRLYCDEQQ